MPIPNENATQFPEFYPPVWGFADYGRRGLRDVSYSKVIYVDGRTADTGSAVGDDDYPGTDPQYPKLTIQSAVDAVTEAGTQIIVAPAAYTENVEIVAADPNYCAIIGAGAQNTGWYPSLTATNTDSPALTIKAEGWLVEGLLFNCPAGSSGLYLWCSTTDTGAYKTTIKDCVFDGAYEGLYGIELYGAPDRVVIEGCEFIEITQGDTTGFAIITTDTSFSNAYECKILSNIFWENENHIGSWNDDTSFIGSLFAGNVFHDGEIIAATRILDLRSDAKQGLNIVTANIMCGDYSNTGGYWAAAGGAAGNWCGNFCEDDAEAEVGPDGISIAVPAA